MIMVARLTLLYKMPKILSNSNFVKILNVKVALSLSDLGLLGYITVEPPEAKPHNRS